MAITPAGTGTYDRNRGATRPNSPTPKVGVQALDQDSQAVQLDVQLRDTSHVNRALRLKRLHTCSPYDAG